MVARPREEHGCASTPRKRESVTPRRRRRKNRDEDMTFMDLPVTYPVPTSSVAAQRRFSRGNREIRPKRYVVDIHPFCDV
jgi:hypothetical protein